MQPIPPQVTGGTLVAKSIFDASGTLLGSIESEDGSTDVLSGLSEAFIRVAETFTIAEGRRYSGPRTRSLRKPPCRSRRLCRFSELG